MIYRLLADAVLLLHLAFILFVVFGGFLVWHHPRLAWLHLPCVAWAAFVEFANLACPLTPLENLLRQLGGAAAFHSSFVEHYLLPLIYPGALTRELQVAIGLGVIGINFVAYALLHRKGRRDT